MMKTNEIRGLQVQDIEDELEKARAKLFRIRFQAKGKDIENPGEMRKLRRSIARMKTVLQERRILAAQGSAE